MTNYYNTHKKDLDKWHRIYSKSSNPYLQYRAKMIEELIIDA